MLFLVQLLKKKDGSFSKGTSEYTSDKECILAMHVAISSAMAKEDTQKIVCMIIDDDGIVIKRDKYEEIVQPAPPVPEEDDEPIVVEG